MSNVSCFDQFDSAKGADTPIRMTICDREGKVTDQWIEFVSTYSDRFQRAFVANSRNTLLRMAADPDYDVDSDSIQSELEMMAACITGWSFPIPCTTENIILFLTKAQHIKKELNKRTCEHERFFGREVINSANTSD